MKVDKIHCECNRLLVKSGNTLTCPNPDCIQYETFYQIPELILTCFTPLHETVDNYNTCDNPLIKNNSTINGNYNG